MSTVYIRPGSGTGTGTLADPYYWSQRTAAEDAVGAGGTVIFFPGNYGYGNGAGCPNQSNHDGITYQGMFRNGTYIYHTGHDVFKSGTTGRMNFKKVKFLVGNSTYNYRQYATNVYFDQCTIVSGSTGRPADTSGSYSAFKEITNSLIHDTSTYSGARLKAGVKIHNSTYVADLAGADLTVGTTELKNVLLYAKVANTQSSIIGSNSEKIWTYNIASMTTSTHPTEVVGDTDPLLADPSNDRFRPKPSSPLWEAGVVLA